MVLKGDNDGYGLEAYPVEGCFLPEGYASEMGDCNDLDPLLYPADLDGDGYTACNGDCNDTNASILPVISCDGLDNECDGLEEILIPQEFASIRQGISIASSHARICLAPGTYTEDLDFEGKAVHLIGVEGPELTFVDGENSETVLSITSGEGYRLE